jgi:hypothetical protein
VNPDPHYNMDWNGWGPRLAFDWKLNDKTIVPRGGSDHDAAAESLAAEHGDRRSAVRRSLYESAAPGAPISFSNRPQAITLPGIYTPAGQLIYSTGNSMDVAPNTEMDINRFERDLAALSPDKQVRAVSAAGMARTRATATSAAIRRALSATSAT